MVSPGGVYFHLLRWTFHKDIPKSKPGREAWTAISKVVIEMAPCTDMLKFVGTPPQKPKNA